MSEQVSKIHTVLLVDDEKFILRILSDTMTTHAENIITARNGQEGFDKAVDERPDLIISDVMMPVMNGIEFLQQIRKNEITKDIPFILLTVKDTTQDMLVGYEHGADYYLPKPYQLSELLEAIDRAVTIRRERSSRNPS